MHTFSVQPYCSSGWISFNLVPVRRFDTEQVVNKEVLKQSLVVRAARAMSAARHCKQIELFVCADQRIRDLSAELAEMQRRS